MDVLFIKLTIKAEGIRWLMFLGLGAAAYQAFHESFLHLEADAFWFSWQDQK